MIWKETENQSINDFKNRRKKNNKVMEVSTVRE